MGTNSIKTAEKLQLQVWLDANSVSEEKSASLVTAYLEWGHLEMNEDRKIMTNSKLMLIIVY